MSEQIKTWKQRADEASRANEHVEYPVVYMKAEIAELRAALAAAEHKTWCAEVNEDGAREHVAELLKAQAPSAPVAREVPEGWQLVPLKPTLDMLDAELVKHPSDVFVNESLWRAMLAAAPTPPLPGEVT